MQGQGKRKRNIRLLSGLYPNPKRQNLLRQWEIHCKGRLLVKVGSWYKQYEDELRELVADAFNLPDDFVFEIGKHWELGHGWNESQLNDFLER